jgi:putative nucleotidyltransferase with HDIG domain
MNEHSVVSVVEDRIVRLFEERLDKRFTYHHLQHTIKVREAALALADRIGFSAVDREVLELAALLHDAGYLETYEGHEEAGCRLAAEWLEALAYPAEQLARVQGCIMATKISNQPENLLEMAIRDADMSHLAYEAYLEEVDSLRREWAVVLDKTYTDEEWYALNHRFIKGHQYFTNAARALWDERKAANQKLLKKLLKAGEDVVEVGDGRFTTTRSAQMMFKTSLRNHIDLSNLADNKANIMLSINAIIITIAMPLAATYVKAHPFLIGAMLSLLATCLASMFFATMATRPIKMTGYTAREAVRQGQANLFFFGNFFKMSLDEYREGMSHIVADEKRLDSAILRDLFFLGKSLGVKYTQLRTCYTVFLLGIGITVFIFLVSYAIWGF